MNDEIRRQLEAAGRRPVPEPDPGFAAVLEASLLAAAKTQAPAPAMRSTRRWSRLHLPGEWPRLRLTAGVAALAVALVMVAVSSDLGDRGIASLELTGATNVEVALADGTTLVNPDGLLLPDGAVIRVGADGSARIGDIQLASGDVATVANRRLQIDRHGATGQTQPGETSEVTPSAPSSAPPSRSPTPAPASSQPPATSQPEDVPSATATLRPERPSPTPTASQRPSSPPTVDAVRVKLAAKAIGPAEVGAIWTGLPRASSYVLVASVSRQGQATDPRYPGSTVIGQFAYPPSDPLRFRVPLGVVEIRLMVVALTADGAELARSNIVTVPLGA